MAGSIVIEGLEVSRGAFRLKVEHLEIAPGEVFAILGATGSGKTVLLESIAGAFPLTRGSIRLDGREASSLPVRQRRLGILYQDCALFPHMTIRQNVEYGARMRGLDPAAIAQRADELLDLFAIRDRQDCYPGTISGGESQRAALARALVMEPEILLLDEPFSALDPATRKRLCGVVRDVHARFGCTMVFVTHDFNEAASLADRVGVILGGRLRAVRSAEDLFDPAGLDDDVREFLDLAEPPAQAQHRCEP